MYEFSNNNDNNMECDYNSLGQSSTNNNVTFEL